MESIFVLIIPLLWLTIGYMFIARPDIPLRWQTWSQKLIGAQWIPGPRTYTITKVVGWVFVSFGLLALFTATLFFFGGGERWSNSAETNTRSPDLIYEKNSGGLCATPEGEGGCFTRVRLSLSGKLSTEEEYQVYGGEIKVSPTVSEQQLSPEQIEKILSEIKKSDVFNKECPAGETFDYSASYYLHADGIEKEIEFPGCEEELDNIDTLISAFQIEQSVTRDAKADLSSPPETETACLKAGGIWAQTSFDPKKYCNLPTGDSGTVCTDRSQCQGACVGEHSSGDTSGKCSERRWVNCVNQIVNGRSQGLLCAD
ncbi:MAG: hypothetical protein A3C93_00860 [Candidatus Lloydbacteria bacterium RIFCSPHIGHO2_02_FULL_54_17]|uniref:Uncharacterized protein n=1 Tax=Candidatus Lloydbacteria bacterium RIFCSPHIGHO2_02_FULL_54_17 TaxID=1798664 RepID=A0A1G2DHP6_9BACT|nr:MAG: hypothetical protein A2762_05040 [Candidatus Lloydbacteria bacterium RIFCSPHIGHO2_01_FULL_54_11]OGZ13187.1 MAG: hypothetical protein A3C93_00860 [Candidatus Lloydbacteria bacterium RIFCSPHIGHO2_02_FULL_54_17]OGZ16073.1 MAG: hypothetical protein A3H76_01440 [Candidatus Lloydbacteria bacterium RIFCSPLOWO2_02_FULL_54_12]